MLGYQSNRPFHKVAIVLVLLICTTLLYIYQISSPYSQHQSPKHDFSIPDDLDFDQDEPPPEKPSFFSSKPSPKPAASASRYSIKPIAYVFPQYYVFEENSRLHGENFTEWTNVRKVTHNQWGLETIRPHESIGGMYDGLAFETRQRQARFLKESGFYGVAYHHYWFDGKPIMEHILEAMLKDGEPDIPFMLSWANEPWTSKWDGAGGDASDVLIAQDYGLQAAWRKHFDWLLKFFKHPQYIRSEGRIQFMVYNPSHMGDLGPPMYAAWRQWAVEEGLGGLDIIETRWGEGQGSWAANRPDAINEFAPHAGGLDPSNYPTLKKLARVYHRGTMVCWDNTPRHATDGKASSVPLCHPRTWQNHLVEMFRTIKSTPNPIGSENFFFVNALNEWGEGNSLEPSVQFGDAYGIAMKTALSISEKQHLWADKVNQMSLARDKELAAHKTRQADVCVLVRASRDNNAEDKLFKLSAMLRSLQEQENQNWRAVVFQGDTVPFSDLQYVILKAVDARIRHVSVPQKAFPKPPVKDSGYAATDWVIKELNTTDPGCASARYLLVSDGAHTYHPSAFNYLSKSEDIIGLNVESRDRLHDHEMLQGEVSWDDRCTRLEDPKLNLCTASTPTLYSFDLAASFLNLTRFLSGKFAFSDFAADFPGGEPGALAESLTNKHQWSFSGPDKSQEKTCHVHHNPAYFSCLALGNLWFDSPVFEESGCYSMGSFTDTFGAVMPNLKGVDLQFFRKNGRCVRYEKATHDLKTPDVSVKPAKKVVGAAKTTPEPHEEESRLAGSGVVGG
ncbi:uncharacterized protein L3040_006108 [Drepanopeziza brunnea f. sp. 'multigermtubi']|uniref:Conserved domain protein (ISS) n=1 Tax=Marssonina brunnea f. sp. multigermtubi (strain MB_m1) TaxID=1072389 RepID=K1WV41_MARBU|nr:conserved domain protein (ISS) [Drepanopeziza brunnea f. sp. 'multigermtubi' MB_m1]EKD21515.1 conserved domain protein (ISS) [Drepanopeziza brunnea f. sp. 'multigermtubi' MB_m1]KAJ5040452.1 hypothetical protein L3040_006108 [Drepanopeziza brunnea f. sp. 'multigermtubi']